MGSLGARDAAGRCAAANLRTLAVALMTADLFRTLRDLVAASVTVLLGQANGYKGG